MRDISQSLTDSLGSLGRQGATVVRSFFRRAVVHLAGMIGGILCAASLDSLTGISLSGRFALFLATYVGFINLLPSVTNYLTSGLSILLGLALIALGTPWQTAIFWAGGTALLIRLLLLVPLKGVAPSSDRPRTGILVYAVAAALFCSAIHGTAVAFPPVWPFAVALVAAFALRPLYTRIMAERRTQEERTRLILHAREGIDRLESLPATSIAGSPLHALAKSSRAYITMLPPNALPADDSALLRRINGFSEAVKTARLDQQNAVADSAQALASAIEARRAMLLAAAKPRPVRNPQINDEQMARVKEFTALTAQLREKATRQPPVLCEPLLHICEQTDQMLEHITYDARNFSSTAKFLNRYLDAVQRLLTLNAETPPKASLPAEAVTDTVLTESGQTEAMLVRLADAFSAQHARMLEDNALDLRVELGVLDKLLKMDGH